MTPIEKSVILLFLLLGSIGSGFGEPEMSVITTAPNSEDDLSKIRVAVVHQTFTDAAYRSFYTFFRYKKDTSQFFVNVYQTSTMPSKINTALINSGIDPDNLFQINDQDVHAGRIFTEDGLPLYHTLIFQHNEYVTMEEYLNVVRFVQAGGNVVILNGNSFFGEVEYNEETNTLQQFNGHAWEFDGENATQTDLYKGRFVNTWSTRENFDFIGNRYSTFSKGDMAGSKLRTNVTNPHPIALELTESGYGRIGERYNSHEENTLLTPNAHIIGDWQSSFKQLDRGIKFYEKIPFGPYGGSVVHFGIYITSQLSDPSLAEALKLVLIHQFKGLDRPWIRYPYDGGVFRETELTVDFTGGWDTTAYLDGNMVDIQPLQKITGLTEGEHNFTVVFRRGGSSLTRSTLFRIDRTPPTFTINGTIPDGNTKLYKDQVFELNPQDDNLVSLKVQILKGIHQQYRMYRKWSDENNYIPSFVQNLTIEKNTFMSVDLMDAAGNSATRWIEINPGANETVPAMFIPWITRYNQTHMQANIPYHDNRTKTVFQRSFDRGASWERIPFNTTGKNTSTPDNTTLSITFKENNSTFWYRVRYISENDSGYSYTLQKHVGTVNALYVTGIDDNTLSIKAFGRNYPEQIENVRLVDRNGSFTDTSFNISNVSSDGFDVLLDRPVTGAFVQLIGNRNVSLSLEPLKYFTPIYNYPNSSETSSTTTEVTTTSTNSPTDTTSSPTDTTSSTSVSLISSSQTTSTTSDDKSDNEISSSQSSVNSISSVPSTSSLDIPSTTDRASYFFIGTLVATISVTIWKRKIRKHV